MALTRKMLKAFGIEEDVIDQIIEAHTETTDSLKADRDRQKAKAEGATEEADELQKKLDEAKRQLDEAKSDNGYEELEKKYAEEHEELEKLKDSNDALKAEFDKYKEGVESKETERKKTDAYKSLLEKAGIAQKYMGAVLRVAKLDDVELDDDGAIKDADGIVEKVKEEWAEFIPTKVTKGADPSTPPTPSNSPKGANPRAVQIAKERHERLYGKSEE